MSSALISLALQVGAPLVANALRGRLGPANGALAAEVIGKVAGYAGLDVSGLEGAAVSETQRGSVEHALQKVEADMPEMIAVYEAELAGKMRLLEAEQKGPLWTWAWRPAGMWGLGFFWLYNVALLHWANAYFKIALPPVDFSTLIQISALYMSLYMGGHTVKDVMAKWVGGRSRG